MSETSIQVTFEATEEGGRFLAQDEGGTAHAELRFRWDDAREAVAYTTVNFKTSQVKGLGKLLFWALVAWARSEGVKVVPTCSFILKMYHDHPETRDTLSATFPLG